MTNSIFGKPLFDVPVYRLPEARYYAERDASWNKLAASGLPKDRDSQMFLKAHHENQYGGPWRFNEIISWICLSVRGSDLLGAYWCSQAKRITRTRTKVLYCLGHKSAGEYWIRNVTDNTSIHDAIAACFVEMRKKPTFKARYIDTSWYDSVGKFVDWSAYLKSA